MAGKSSNSASALLSEDLFPGNEAAFEQLSARLAASSVIAFTGAGTSVPLAPAWSSLLKYLIGEGVREGFIQASDENELANQIQTDPLELAATIEECFTRSRFRSKLSTVFDLQGKFTTAHELIVSLNIDGVVTLNYDDGLSAAYTHIAHKMPRVIRYEDKYDIGRWLHSDVTPRVQLPILHWHGTAAAPDRTILTADDYNKFYSRQENISTIADLWRSKNLLIIGFGFRDPFLNRIAESVLRDLDVDNRHFALIGATEANVSPLARRTFARKYRVSPIFYPVRITTEGLEDHSALTELLSLIQPISSASESSAPLQSSSIIEVKAVETELEKAKRELESNLFVSRKGIPLYVEPILRKPVSAKSDHDTRDNEPVPLLDVVNGDHNVLIACRYEYGATTLGRRLRYEFAIANKPSLLRSAPDLPNYAAKLRKEPGFSGQQGGTVLILDNVSPSRDERLIKEIVGIGIFSRIILLAKTNSEAVSSLDEFELPFSPTNLFLDQISRANIRTIARDLFDTFDVDLVSGAVDKTYNDLLELCIPLTPSNIIMYLTVVRNEGDFVPLNRIQIISTYITGLLERPSDIYRDSFNVNHKIDILSSFVYNLYCKGDTSFTANDWLDFTKSEMDRSLSSFDAEGLLQDLIGSRFIYTYGLRYHFKYKLFYSFFLGQFLDKRNDVQREFIAQGRHVTLDGMVEILAALGKDNAILVEDLTARLRKANDAFYSQYKVAGLDPYKDIKWAIDEEEQKRLWAPVAQQLANGPASDDEVDKLKRSIVAEQKTSDQMVMIREFSEIERSATYNQKLLIAALRESRGIDRDLKIAALNEIYRCYEMVMHIGVLFAPIIATRRFFAWNNVTFINNLTYSDEQAKDETLPIRTVMTVLPRAISERAAHELGVGSLGDLLKHFSLSYKEDDFRSYINFTSLVKSKSEKWEEVADDHIKKMQVDSFYMRYCLDFTMDHFKHGVSTIAQRSSLKRLVGTIRAKREFRKEVPSQRMVENIVAALDRADYFEPDSDNVGEGKTS